MLEIRNQSGLTLQLPPDTRLAVELVSTIFNTDDVLPGSHSYPFKFGLNENNRLFIGNSHRPEREAMPAQPVYVRAGSLHFMASMGFKVSGRYADAWLLVELGEVASSIRRQSLRSFVTEKYNLGNTGLQLVQRLRSLAMAEPAQYPIVFPPMRNDLMVEPEFKPTDAPYNRPTVFNRFNPVVGGYTVSQKGTSGEALLLPCVYVAWLIRHVCSQLGYTAQGTFFTDPDLMKLILDNTQTLPGWNFDNGGYTVDIARHLPDISISEFFKALRGWAGMGIFFDARTRTATFTTYRHIRLSSEPPTDLTEGYIPDQDGIEQPDAKGYVVNNYVEQADELMAERTGYRKAFTVGQPDQDVSLSIGTRYMSRQPNYDHPANGSWIIPHCKQPGNVADPFFQQSRNYTSYEPVTDPALVPEAKNKFGLSFLLYHGMQPDAGGHLYPYASSVSYNAKYQAVGGLSLMPGEPDDMFRRYQRFYYEWLANARSITIPMLLKLPKLNQVQLHRPIALKTAHQVYGKYLIESLMYELPAQDGQLLTKLKARQLVPVVVKYSIPDADLYSAIWVQMVHENPTTQEEANYRLSYADLVLYFWLDGTFTEPFSPPTILINYTTYTETYQADGTVVVSQEEKSVSASGHRYVIQEGVLMKEENRREDNQYYLDVNHFNQLQPGTGYRI